MPSIEIKIHHAKPIYTQQHLQKLVPNLTENQILKIAERIGLVLYGYQIYTNLDQQPYKVYKNHNQIMMFLHRIQKKYKTKLTFQKLQTKEGLHQIMQCEGINEVDWFRQFIEYEDRQFNKVASIKLKKKSGGRYFRFECCGGCRWKLCNFVIINDGILYYHKSKDQVKEFLHFGKDFQWKVGQYFQQRQIIIYSYHRKLTLKAINEKQYFLFLFYLNEAIKQYQENQQQYRFNSFAPVRQGNAVTFFVDGAQYFENVALRIEQAKQQIFICGWWVSPEFHLIRPCKGKNLQYRLDKLLKRVASKNNVRIYIVVYYQSSFLTNDSQHTIKALTKLHSNIKVLRHPQIILPTFWSHHEKLVVIDQSEAFLGGLDLCYGRYDNSNHLINDNLVSRYPGIQYNNCRIKDFTKVRQYWNQNVLRTQQRLPWHDVTMFVKGEVVKDLSRHFIQYWNYASYQTHYADRYVLVSKTKLVKKPSLLRKFQQWIGQQKTKHQEKNVQFESQKNNPIQFNLNDLRLSRKGKSQKFFSFKEHFNSSQNQKQPYHIALTEKEQEKELRNIQLFSNFKEDGENDEEKVDQIDDLSETEDIEVDPDIEVFEEKKRKIKNSILKIAEIQINIDEEEQQKGQYLEHQYLHERNIKIEEQKYEHGRISNFFKKIMEKLKPQQQQQMQEVHYEEMHDSCQVLRSASQWSIGCRASSVEKSISQAYYSIIMNAQKFIYIENQFFISATKTNGVVKNRIMQAIANRIIKAVENQEKFRVIVIMPLVPGFAGELDDPDATLPRVIMNWQYKTICRGQNSLIERVRKVTNQPQNYIQFYSLRNHGIVNSEPKTQIIYLHSKLIIVDDRKLILGSANINDRSMEGDRDSQLCLMVDQNLDTECMIDGDRYQVNSGIQELRIKLWREHFQLNRSQCQDVLNPEFRDLMRKRAKVNTELYREIFGCYPDDNIRRIEQINAFGKKEVDKEGYAKLKKGIVGHIVEFPLHFLEKESLSSLHPNLIST